MNKAQFLNLFQYELWTNRKMIETLQSLDNLPGRVPEVFSHILDAQITWLSRLRGEQSPRNVWDNIAPDQWLTELESYTEGFKAYIEALEEVDLDRPIAYKNSAGHHFETSIGDILVHVLIHSGYHRGQIVAWIRPQLEKVPTFDYIFYLRE